MSNTELFKAVGNTIEFRAEELINPKEYYKDRKGLVIWSSFVSRIVSKATAIKIGTEFKVTTFDLATSATDAQIEEALPAKHIFNEDEVCAVVADLINKQPGGEEGTLQNDGCANLFYTTDFVVRVLWDSWDGGWSVDAYGRVGSGWRVGVRVFSPATES